MLHFHELGDGTVQVCDIATGGSFSGLTEELVAALNAEIKHLGEFEINLMTNEQIDVIEEDLHCDHMCDLFLHLHPGVSLSACIREVYGVIQDHFKPQAAWYEQSGHRVHLEP